MLLKRLAGYGLLAALLFILAYHLHRYILNSLGIRHVFSLFDAYVFNALASLSICVVFDAIASLRSRLRDQLGFLYLTTLLAKIGLFCIMFKNTLFSGNPLSRTDSLSLLIPIFIYLFYEVFLLAKILNRKPRL